MSDFTRYQQLRDAMAAMLKAGQFQTLPFQDAWQQMETLKNKNGGLPPLPENSDYEADNMEAAETANLQGLR